MRRVILDLKFFILECRMFMKKLSNEFITSYESSRTDHPGRSFCLLDYILLFVMSKLIFSFIRFWQSNTIFNNVDPFSLWSIIEKRCRGIIHWNKRGLKSEGLMRNNSLKNLRRGGGSRIHIGVLSACPGIKLAWMGRLAQ